MPSAPLGRGELPASSSRAELTAEQVGRLACLIAEGRCELPDDLPSGDVAIVVDATRRQLRERLIRLFAQAIARRLDRVDDPISPPRDCHA